MIHATNIWVFMLLILGVFIMECGNRSNIGIGASTLSGGGREWGGFISWVEWAVGLRL
jgi:hypothetical protein